MLTLLEQESIRLELERLSNEELIEIWNICGISFTPDHPEDVFASGDREWLIGPLFADTEYKQLKEAISEIAFKQ